MTHLSNLENNHPFFNLYTKSDQFDIIFNKKVIHFIPEYFIRNRANKIFINSNVSDSNSDVNWERAICELKSPLTRYCKNECVNTNEFCDLCKLHLNLRSKILLL